MTKPAKLWIGAGAIYGLMAVFTFGHAAQSASAATHASYAECVRDPNRIACFDDSTFQGGASGIMGGLAWPLYWSWELQE